MTNYTGVMSSPQAVRISENPDSRPTGAREGGNLAVKVWELPEPGPRNWILSELLPEGAITILYGAGGQGKSYLALSIATAICLGEPFAGRVSRRGKVLYLDAEMDQDEFIRRAYLVARGAGLERPPEGLYYYRLLRPLGVKEVQVEIETLVESNDVDLIVLDSLTVASFSSDTKDAKDVLAVLKALEAVGTVLAIDHVAKPQSGPKPAPNSPYGSVFKGNIARSVIQVRKGKSPDTIVLEPQKANFSGISEPTFLKAEFAGDRVRYTSSEPEDYIADLSTANKVACELSRHSDGRTPAQLAEDLKINEKTIRNHLTGLKKLRQAERIGDSRWKAIPDDRNTKAPGIQEPRAASTVKAQEHVEDLQAIA
jgi:hypothetical protein